MNRAEKMLEGLSDGQPKTRHELFQDAGEFYLTNNAASELRAMGYAVIQWREGALYLYQLVSLEGAAAIPEETAAPSSEPTEAPPAARSPEQLFVIPATEAPPWA